MIESSKTRASRDRSKPVVWEAVEERSIGQPPYETPNTFLAETIRQNVGKRRACLAFGRAEGRNTVRQVHRKTGIAGIRQNVVVPSWVEVAAIAISSGFAWPEDRSSGTHRSASITSDFGSALTSAEICGVNGARGRTVPLNHA